MNAFTSRDEGLGAALRSLETPDHQPGFDDELRRRLTEKPRRSPPQLLAIAAALAAVVTVPALVLMQSSGSDEPRDWSAAVGDLPALAPGKPKARGTGSTSSMEYVSRDDLIARATRVFVGTVVAEGGPEFADPQNVEHPRMTVHRVRFSVERTLRGEETDALDLTIPDFDPTLDVFEVGDRLLVFARMTEFGALSVPGLVPEGYFQGVFPARDDGTAGSGDVTFSLDELEEELRR
jgi:hypothetical protein